MKPQGVKVGHDTEEIKPDTEVILTLRDSSVLDMGSVLENVELTEQFKASKSIEARKLANSRGNRHEYTGFEDSEARELLSKYDDPMSQGKDRGFQLDVTGSAQSSAAPPTVHSDSLSVPKTVATDYTPFRRPKKRHRGGDIVAGFEEGGRTAMRDRFMENSQKTPKVDSKIVADEEEKELEMSLNRQLRSGNRNKKETEEAGEPRIGRVQDEGTVFNTTKEFIDAVASEKERLEAKRLAGSGLSLKDSAKGTTSVVNVALPSERLRMEKTEQNSDVVPDASQQPTDTRDALTQELFMGRGLAECLLLLRQRAALKPARKKFGRANDDRKEGETESNEGLTLEYRDEKGRLLSKRQAFRQQCYAFHNDQPGKNKVEKLLKRAKLEEDRAGLDYTKGGLTFRAQKDVMAKTKQPFVVMSKPK